MANELEAAQIELATRRQILALEDLYDSVCAEFVAQGLTVDQPFDDREKKRQLGDKPRIVWAPGTEQGELGKVTAARNPGRNPRPLLTLNESFHCQITGFDAAAPQVFRAQWKATRLLFDAWLRAVYLAAHGTFEITSSRWLLERSESRFGLSLVVSGAIQSMIPDSTDIETPTQGASADITVEVLDPADLSVILSEHQITPETP